MDSGWSRSWPALCIHCVSAVTKETGVPALQELRSLSGDSSPNHQQDIQLCCEGKHQGERSWDLWEVRVGLGRVLPRSLHKDPKGPRRDPQDMECSWQRSQMYKGSWVGTFPGCPGSVQEASMAGAG